MPGYMIAIGGCFVCGQAFEFNVDWVPSVHDSEGIRQPICRKCMNEINAERIKLGNEPFEIHPMAYAYGEDYGRE